MGLGSCSEFEKVVPGNRVIAEYHCLDFSDLVTARLF